MCVCVCVSWWLEGLKWESKFGMVRNVCGMRVLGGGHRLRLLSVTLLCFCTQTQLYSLEVTTPTNERRRIKIENKLWEKRKVRMNAQNDVRSKMSKPNVTVDEWKFENKWKRERGRVRKRKREREVVCGETLMMMMTKAKWRQSKSKRAGTRWCRRSNFFTEEKYI